MVPVTPHEGSAMKEPPTPLSALHACSSASSSNPPLSEIGDVKHVVRLDSAASHHIDTLPTPSHTPPASPPSLDWVMRAATVVDSASSIRDGPQLPSSSTSIERPLETTPPPTNYESSNELLRAPQDPGWRTIRDWGRTIADDDFRVGERTRSEIGSESASRKKTGTQLIPLAKLIKAGTIVLRGYELRNCNGSAMVVDEDGWFRFAAESVVKFGSDDAGPTTMIDADGSDAGPSTSTIVFTSKLPYDGSLPPASPKPIRARAKRKAKPLWTRRSSKKSIESATSTSPSALQHGTGDPLLEELRLLTSALFLRATCRPLEVTDGVSDVEGDERVVIFRIYLVPDDLEERFNETYTKGRRVRPPSSVILEFLQKIKVGQREWDGSVAGHEGGDGLLDEKDQRSILELYRAVRAPPSDPSFIETLQDVDQHTCDRIRNAMLENPLAMKTEMFPYQRASLAKMLTRELAPQWSIDPAYTVKTEVGNNGAEDMGAKFYVSVEGRISKHPVFVREPKSGILAEDMGSGKTCICLGLILATKGELPILDENVGTWLDGEEGSPAPVVVSQLSMGFPFETELKEARRLRPRVPEPLLALSEMDAADVLEYEEALRVQAIRDAREDVLPPVPTLRMLMIDYLSTMPRAVPYPVDDDRFESLGIAAEIANFPPFYYVHPSPAQLQSRQGRQIGFGARRCAKETFGPDAGKMRIQAQEMMMTRTTLVVVPAILVKQWETEMAKHLVPGALKVKTIKTPKDRMITVNEVMAYDVVLMSIARFSEAADAGDNVLRKIHWKRLIVDEGHALSGANKMRDLAEELRCEARWAVSGTPSVNLRAEADTLPTAASKSSGAFAALDVHSGGSELDYRRLGQLFSRFLRHPSFSRVEDWRKVMTVPILEHSRGATRLSRVFDETIVRNPLEVVRQVVQLPPLTTRVVYLDMEELERKTYNALLALFANNSILSQRTDRSRVILQKDYFFHESQKGALNDLVSNLSASSFFFASRGLVSQIRFTIKSALDEGFTTEKAKKFSDEDRQRLKRSIEVMQEAVDDPRWCHVVDAMSVATVVRGVDRSVAEMFQGLPLSGDEDSGDHLMSLGSLITLRGDLQEVRMPDIGAWDDDEELREELLTFEAKRLRESSAVSGSIEDIRAKEERKRLNKARKVAPRPLRPRPLPADSSFRNVSMGRTTSAKLNHVISECRRYAQVKFIIFSCTLPDLVFAILSEAFDLVGIKHMVFAGHARGANRGTMAQQFNESSVKECQAILVDARLGGRGLNLTAASRVVMLEPLWQPDLEIQAIKRAHRLGQTRPVDLSILVVRGSYEDSLLQRRSQLSANEIGETKLPQRDEKLRGVLQSAEYLEPPSVAGRVDEKGKGRQVDDERTFLFGLDDDDTENEVQILAEVKSGPVFRPTIEHEKRGKGRAEKLATRKKRSLIPYPTFTDEPHAPKRAKKSVQFAIS
ncbi:BZ3500_MvSof-1268-A1-R1_Chr10-1g02549 [Microbotryum saponariae]|uniref:BZ3500_MvSof-1268-A1-R1_Chr10-1g02549 protein n=1 Tax=Microbotryum saponariae TaxID=289078 RepID=A0A2X0L6R1_9BASI|nr:BZ3500_MvSof-1268-A1-R1_Chr10-1g02549 [Microbotryum saponariae]SDA06038.1 BZ3501_MvSof-1269-A2-R1_Chr10-1g02150 [Microbotryum saponariae]